MSKQSKNNIPPLSQNHDSWLVSTLAYLLGFGALCVALYFGFSLLFDTRIEHNLQANNQALAKELKVLNKRFNNINQIIDNIESRDANVFKILFESEPYDLSQNQQSEKLKNYDALLSKTTSELAHEFTKKLNSFERRTSEQQQNSIKLIEATKSLGSKTNYIPAIQPVINPELTLLASSYGMRMHPFYRTLSMHEGIDFSLSLNSRIFATADGRVSSVSTKSSNTGNSVTIDHGNGFKTVYNHLGKINVKNRQTIRRGDIIALSGNSGLSFAPHLHYEVIKDGQKVNPIHYFFMELEHNNYKKIMSIAQSSMQSLD